MEPTNTNSSYSFEKIVDTLLRLGVLSMLLLWSLDILRHFILILIWAIVIAIAIFSVADSTTAIILAIWLGITLMIDNVLKPILLGRNAPAPMLVIFLGAIGGFLYNGFIGLFLGVIIPTIGYEFFMVWLETEN